MHSDTLPPPVFVLAAPALPGPTLAAALGRNPAAYGLPEINLPFEATADVYQREVSGLRGPQSHGLLRALAQLLAGEQSLGSVEMARRWLDRRAYLPTTEVFREVAGLVAPRRMVAPAVSLLLDPPAIRRLIATFPEARYVVLRVHPLTYGQVALGSRAGHIALQLSGAVDETADPPFPDPQDLWLRVEQALAANLSGLGDRQVLSVDAADLVRAPAETLRGLARSLGMKWNAEAVAAMAAPELSPFAGPGPMGAHSNGQVFPFAEIAAGYPDPAGATLEGPLPWHPGGAGFRAEVAETARGLGFG